MYFATFLQYYLTGFAIYSLIWILLKKKLIKHSSFDFLSFDTIASKGTAFFSLLYFLFVLLDFLLPHELENTYTQQTLYAASPYFILQCFTTVLTQSLWFKPMRKGTIFRILILLLLFIDKSESILYLTSLHRGSTSTPLVLFSINTFSQALFAVVDFTLTTVFIYLIFKRTSLLKIQA
ncbi:hypothetical protein SAMN05216474_0325 [Lishizhenia tianjinensis]|uniref:Uncharacterized protein n=1 Tax=Lishizhenia tianjinensis TaxID=477690 RepID=A0A1I6XMW0_9FLAO|nr:hypothetical protein SAMN05216474_0325 [Lishizhenia tianjinensis]